MDLMTIQFKQLFIMKDQKTIEQLKQEYEAAEMEYQMCDASNDWDRLRSVRDQKKKAYVQAGGVV